MKQRCDARSRGQLEVKNFDWFTLIPPPQRLTDVLGCRVVPLAKPCRENPNHALTETKKVKVYKQNGLARRIKSPNS